MAKSKEDIKYATAQAKVSEDDGLRVRYKAGTPLEGGKIADSQPLDLFSGATRNSSSSSMPDQQPPGPIAESQPVDLFSGAHNISGADHVQHRTQPHGGGGGSVAPSA